MIVYPLLNFRDVVAQTSDGNIEIISHKDDLVYNRNDDLVEHWKMEKLLSTHKDVKGVQVRARGFLVQYPV